MIETRNIVYQYDDSREIRFPDLKLEEGGKCLVLGESGSGKTTLLHLIGGLLRLQTGTVHIGETDIAGLGESALDHFRGQRIGFIFQRNHLISALSVKQNLMMAPFLAGVEQDESRVEEVLRRLGLDDKIHANVKRLSHGQAQRVAIARAVINKPQIILADEPTSALDDTNCSRVIELLLSVAEENKSALLVATHDQRLKAVIENQVQL